MLSIFCGLAGSLSVDELGTLFSIWIQRLCLLLNLLQTGCDHILSYAPCWVSVPMAVHRLLSALLFHILLILVQQCRPLPMFGSSTYFSSFLSKRCHLLSFNKNPQNHTKIVFIRYWLLFLLYLFWPIKTSKFSRLFVPIRSSQLFFYNGLVLVLFYSTSFAFQVESSIVLKSKSHRIHCVHLCVGMIYALDVKCLGNLYNCIC